ncbi:MAG: FliG C-terminal domain-containing protein [Rhodomicrobium sp.]
MIEINVSATPPRKLKGIEKAAALLLAVGKENASRIIAHLGEEEIRAIARSASDLGSISGTVIEDIASEFMAQVTTDGGIRASTDQVKELLEKTLPTEQVKQIMSDVRARMNEAVWPRLAETPAQVLSQFLNKEHPQVITFVLSKVPTSLSAEVVALLASALRNEVMRRMLTNRLVTQHALRLLEQVLRDELLLKVARTSGQDAHARIAKIINKLDRRDMEEVLGSLHASRPKAAQIVRSLLFTFDDIARLPVKTRTALMENIQDELLILALNGAEQAFKDLILSSVPSRTRRVIEQELALAAPLSAKDVERARREVSNIALQLAEQGAIDLAFAGADE